MFKNKNKGIRGRVIEAINKKLDEAEKIHTEEQNNLDDAHYETINNLQLAHQRSKQDCTDRHVDSILSRII